MGKLIVNEQDVKRIVDESTTNKTGIINQFVNKEIQAEVNKLHLDLSNYNLKHKEENNLEHPDWNYPKVDFIVNDMQQGNVLLKIACQLYVD